jgi:hypothetical protein
MKRKQDNEGYLLIDHRNAGAGVPDDVMRLAGLPAGAGRGLFEAATITCNHCQKTWAKNPLRTRPREWCKHCDHYLCEECAAVLHATGSCRPYKAVVEEAYEAALNGRPVV